MHKNELPYISVILTAYDRKEFLLNAIKSAINQTLDQKYYEIIVVKNFEDKTIDDFINKNKIINVLSNNPTGSAKIMEGLDISKGEIISFLDDDDLFTDNKLEIVYNKFKNDNNLVYYHNDNILVNDKYEKIDNDINRGIAFNMSSISIKKEVININRMKRISINKVKRTGSNFIAIDTFMYLSALESNQYIIDDKEKLTYYMYHNSYFNYITKDFNEFKKYRISQSEMGIKVSTAFKEIFTSKKAINYLNGKIANEEIENYIFCGNKKVDNPMNIFKINERSVHIRIETFLLYILVRMHNNSRNFVVKKLFYMYKKRADID